MILEKAKYKRVIIKVGSSSLMGDDLSVREEVFDAIMKNFKVLKEMSVEPCLVTSGAIALGRNVLKLDKKPRDMGLKQACAAVGQAKLMEYYNKYAEKYSLTLGQILVNHDDFQIRNRTTHLTDTLDSMYKCGIIPVINENDALSVDEIKVGDNDTLASLITPMVGADLLILFSDIDGLYDKDPKKNKDATLIDFVDKIDDKLYSFASGSTSSVGTGGMETKLNAAVISTAAGSDMIICNSREIDRLADIVFGYKTGTFFKRGKGVSSREHWIIFKTNSAGSVSVDDGLVEALKDKKISILPMGITGVSGKFDKGAVVEVIAPSGKTIGKGITKFSSDEIALIKGKKGGEISEKLGYKCKIEVIHANDLVTLSEDFYGRIVK